MFKDKESGAITAGILSWMAAAIMLVIMLPILAAVLSATPLIESGPFNETQVSVGVMVGSSYGLIVVVLIVFAAVILLGVVGYLQDGNQA